MILRLFPLVLAFASVALAQDPLAEQMRMIEEMRASAMLRANPGVSRPGAANADEPSGEDAEPSLRLKELSSLTFDRRPSTILAIWSTPPESEAAVIDVPAGSTLSVPVSVTTKAGDNSVSATVAYTYDEFGSVKTEEGPLAGTADTTRTFQCNFRPSRWCNFACTSTRAPAASSSAATPPELTPTRLPSAFTNRGVN